MLLVLVSINNGLITQHKRIELNYLSFSSCISTCKIVCANLLKQFMRHVHNIFEVFMCY